MAYSPQVAKAYASRYTRAQLDAALDAALADHASGVTMTAVNMGAHGSSGQINGRPEDVIETLLAAIEYKAGTRTSLDAEPLASRANFGTRMTET